MEISAYRLLGHRRFFLSPFPERRRWPPCLKPVISRSRNAIGGIATTHLGSEPLQRRIIARDVVNDARCSSPSVFKRFCDALRRQRIERHGGVADGEPT